MSLETHLSADVFLKLPPKNPATTARNSNTLIYFIPGNPGLIGYYHDFLSLQATSPSNSPCTIAGFSLGGFDISASPPPAYLTQIQHPKGSPLGPTSIYSLRDQIDLTYLRIGALVEALQHSSPPTSTQGDPPIGQYNVLLIGHSVGAYIALEVIRRLHAEHLQVEPQKIPAYTVSGAILLTPTIVDIAKSCYGRIVTPMLMYAPFVDGLAQWAAWGVSGMLPARVLEGAVGRITGLKGGSLKTTLNWLRSRRGVRQTIRMGGEEMREMGEDGWGREVWGGVEGLEGEGEIWGRWKAPRVVLYFAREDHWVDDETREAIVKARQRVDAGGKEDKSWPRIVVEESGKLVHGWCIEQSKEVAEKVTAWIEEIME